MTQPIEGILKLQQAQGMNEKISVIQAYCSNIGFRLLLEYALDPTITFHLSEASLKNCEAVSEKPRFPTIFDLCETLRNTKYMTASLLYDVRVFLGQKPEPEKTIYMQLLSKTLRLGVTGSTVNKVIPELIHEWEVQQAFPIEKYPIKPGTWFCLTQKLNGVRATYCRGRLYARSGVPYEGLDHILREIEAVLPKNAYVLDGELTLRDASGLSDNEAFRIATGIINSDAPHKILICYTVFDIIPTEEFLSKRGETTYSERRYSERRGSLYMLEPDMRNCQYVKVLPALYSGTDQSKIPELLDKMVREDKEGLIANLDVPYQCRRHRGILKIKRFYTMDLPILTCEEGSGKLAGTLGAFVLDYMGNEVRVGSGFTDEERRAFWSRRAELPGLLCEVKYKEISSDKKTGAKSLQFPVFVRLRDDKSEASYG